MKIEVIKKFETEIHEIHQLEEQSIPKDYQEPFFIIIESREDFRVSFLFHAKKEILRNSGKTRYFDNILINAQEYDSFSHALAVAHKFKRKDFSPEQKFYVVGIEQAKIIQIKNEEDLIKFEDNIKKFKKSFEKS